uniref:Uncharacterized protein n=1 Tax=Arundo donax TaxID=35708 RepID=A0A0A8YWM9_ARUDO
MFILPPSCSKGDKLIRAHTLCTNVHGHITNTLEANT